jgi:hypothetical protein
MPNGEGRGGGKRRGRVYTKDKETRGGKRRGRVYTKDKETSILPND